MKLFASFELFKVMFVRLFLATIFLLQDVTSYKSYQNKIPNGDKVSFPCKPGQLWEGVGHLKSAGTGDRNPFGLDFAAAGYTWSEALCRKDSDGDGRTNGNELGDPNCTWKENTKPERSANISHPGICDQWNNPTCSQKSLTSGPYKTQQEWMADQCKSDKLDCPALSESGIMTLDLRVPSGTPVPAQVTTYECQIFNLTTLGIPSNQDFHIVAVTPIIDNKYILHHMTITACDDDTEPTDGPYKCGMSASPKCQEFMHVWTVGLSGECYHPLSGVRIGQTGVKIAAIQLHWNNPDEARNLVDSSGLRIYFTSKLRPYDAGVLMTGATNFELPARQQEVIIRSTCASGCTSNQMLGPIRITSAWNHMHYAGRKMNIEVHRENKAPVNLTDDQAYSYDSPVVYAYPEPFVFMPGDSMKTTCVYNTLDRNYITVYGEATKEEMCFGFITYYPKMNMTVPYCTDIKGVSYCNSESLEGCTDIHEFLGMNKTMFQTISSSCQIASPCLPECVDTIVKYKETDPCFKGNIWQYSEYVFSTFNAGREFLQRLLSCQKEVEWTMNQPAPGAGTTTETSFTATMFGVFIIYLLT